MWRVWAGFFAGFCFIIAADILDYWLRIIGFSGPWPGRGGLAGFLSQAWSAVLVALVWGAICGLIGHFRAWKVQNRREAEALEAQMARERERDKAAGRRRSGMADLD